MEQVVKGVVECGPGNFPPQGKIGQGIAQIVLDLLAAFGLAMQVAGVEPELAAPPTL